MIENKKVLAIIPARGGSKRIPKKNIKEIDGAPLISYAINGAKESKYIDRIITSTDSEEIASVALAYGSEVPFLRPAKFANDEALDLVVFKHALSWLRENENYIPDIVVQLRPTSPLRTAEDIDRTIEALCQNPNVDSARTVAEPDQSPYKMYSINEAGLLEPLLRLEGQEESFNLPGQKLPKAYKHVGYVDVMWTRTITERNQMTGTKILPVILETAYSGINTIKDFEYSEFLLKNSKENDYIELAKTVKAVALDADGVIFTGRVFVSLDGSNLKERSHIDAQGVSLLRAAGIRIAVISGGVPAFLEMLDKQFNSLPSVQNGLWPRVEILSGKNAQRQGKVELADFWLKEINIPWSECAFMGDDISDYDLMKKVGLAAAPAQAESLIRDMADFVAPRRGGDGAVRDLADLILKAQNIDVTNLTLK